MTAPRSINSMRPFISTAREYIDKGWGVLPLPRRKKEHPPIGFTGRAGKFADDDDVTNWLADPQFSEGNIALRVGNQLVIDGERFEIIGIDVDAHSGKHGAKELEALEAKLGKLPDTWTSSSRDDGVSGIRFYLVPFGYGFRGKASDSIDIVQRVHRYAVIYPSWHPDTKTQYFWYEPGNYPDGVNFTVEIPCATVISRLSDEWIDHLTAGRMADTSSSDGYYGIDLDIPVKDLMVWAEQTFNKSLTEEQCGDTSGQCQRMKTAVANAIDRINSSPSNHDKLINAHWNILHLCAEGHSGWKEAIEEVEAVWLKDIKEKQKRDISTVSREMKRSFLGSLRKMKAKADSWRELGMNLFSPETCMSAKGWKPPPVNIRGAKVTADGNWIYSIALEQSDNPEEYDCNDVSQAKFFIDRVADNIHYLADYNGWIIFDGSRWHIDDFTLVRDLYDRACVKPSRKRGYQLLKKLAQHLASGGLATDAIGAPLKRNSAKLLKVADIYRNDNKIKGMLNCLKSIPGVAMKYNQLNWDQTILAMPNGKVLKLEEYTGKANPTSVGFRTMANRKEFYTTYTTAVEYIVPTELSERETSLWKGYLDLFLPDHNYRRFVQKALGYIIFGGNPEKLAFFLVGPRNTGKTTMINAIQAALGDYGETFQPNAVFKDSGTGNNPELGNLLHKRGIFSSESGSQRIHANPFKRNTGGDKVSVTRKYANAQIVGIPHFITIVATNQPPTIDDADEALVKRIMVLPFDIQVDDSHNDKRADVIIPRDARKAVLSWLIDGYKRYVREGLDYRYWPDTVKAATLEFASELSDVATFLNETVEVASDSIKIELASDLIDGYHEEMRKQWSRILVNGLHNNYLSQITEGQKPLSVIAFGKKVRQMFGVKTIPVRQDGGVIKCYLGLKWKNASVMNQVKG